MKYYIPAYGGPYPWTVLGALELDVDKKPLPPAFESKFEALKWAENKVHELNSLHENQQK